MSSSEIALNECVRIERDGPVAFIVIDNPPVNAGSWGVRSGLVAAVASVAAEADVQAAVLIGAGSTFIAGSDIKEFDKPLRDPQVPLVISALEACPKPIVAAIHGASLGGGFEIALACDARVTTADAVVGLPEVQLGIIPGAGGTQRVPRLAGVAKAIELIAGGSRVPASEALKLGLLMPSPIAICAPSRAVCARHDGRKRACATCRCRRLTLRPSGRPSTAR